MDESRRRRIERNNEMARESVNYNLKKSQEYTKNGGKPVKWKVVNGKHVFDGYER